MPIYSKDSLETLRQRIDLVDLLTSHLDLKKAGASYKGLCPFHDEKSPSFMVQKGDKHYHCFGCGAHGDAIQFLMAHQKLNFFEAVENLAQRFHVTLDVVEGSDENKGPNKSLLKEALDHANRFYHFMLLHTPEGQVALNYLYERGLDLEFIIHFQIGYAPRASGMLRKTLHAKFVKDETMMEAGLLTQSKEGGSYRDFFSDRITFPIRDSMGAVIGFSARKYKEETTGGKYVNTQETALFKKSRVLFGLNYCRRRIAKERKALVVEGQIDALRLIQAGFNITVAGQGTAFGEGHVRELITLGVTQVFLALDGDEAGQQATLKIGNLFQKDGVEVHIVQLPKGTDPDAFLRTHGTEGFMQLLETSIDYLTFLVRFKERNLNMDSPAGKNQLVQEIAQQIRAWDHSLMVHESLRRLAHLTNVPEEIIGVGQEHSPNIYIKKSASVSIEAINPDRIMESDLLRWLLLLGETQPKFVDRARLNLKPEQLSDPTCRNIYQTYMESHEKNLPCDLLSLAARLENSEGQQVISDLLHKKVNAEKAEAQFAETIQQILNRNWMQEREAIKVKIHSGQYSDDDALELAKQFEELRKTIPLYKEC
jgi:DNA primase